MNKTSSLSRPRIVRILAAILAIWLLQYAFFTGRRRIRAAYDARLQKDRTDSTGQPVLTLVLAASNKTEGLGWPKDELSRDVDTVVYYMDEPPRIQAKLRYRLPKSKGRETMVYLSYIIDHYHNLPELMVFMRSPKQQANVDEEFFQGSQIKTLERLQTRKISRDGYFNLRCAWEPGCPRRLNLLNATASSPLAAPDEAAILRKAIHELLPATTPPEWVAQPSGNQFAASRDKIQSIPLDIWRNFRAWLLDTSLTDEQANTAWTYLWQLVFTGQAVSCPVVELCYCEGYGLCFLSPTKFAVWRAWSREARAWQAEYDALQIQIKQNVAGARAQALDLKDKLDARKEVLSQALDAAVSWGNELRDRGDESVHYGVAPDGSRLTMEVEGAAFGV